MAGATRPGPLGIGNDPPPIDEGTSALTRAAAPVIVGAPTVVPQAAAAADLLDAEIEALDLAPAARTAAYALKKAHPAVRFTSGRRGKTDQARAMASNVVKNRKWIEETYAQSTLRTKCQDWVAQNADKTTQADIAAGLVSVFDAVTDEELGKFSRHLSGMAFDVQPVDTDADAIKNTIRGLAGIDKFLDKEGGLVRWHAQF